MKKLLALLFAAIMLLSVASAEIVNTEPTMPVFTKIEASAIAGYRYDGVNTFKGIPYATAERFGMPQKVAPWEETRWYTVYGYVAPAGKYSTNFAELLTTSTFDFIENEDCLNLNVWTPSVTAEDKLPVLVWLHGGGYSSGSSAELVSYDGHNLARDGKIVFVSVNHRLNVLGFTDLSAYSDELKYSGNAGMADLVAALEWVRDNIANFGGDPENVTIMGQSGGGGKVMTLMGIPSAQGLFKKAVCLSGGAGGVQQETQKAAVAQMVTNLGLDGKTGDEIVAALRALPYDDLKAAASAARVSSNPVIDGDFYPACTITDGVFSPLSKDVPLIVSTVIAEMTSNGTFASGAAVNDYQYETRFRPNVSEEKLNDLIKETYGDKTDAVIEAFKAAYPEKTLYSLYYIANRNNNIVTAKAGQDGANVYQCVNTWTFPFYGGVEVAHSMDFAFWFRNMDKIPYQIAGAEKEAFAAADFVSGALINFLYTGTPNSGDFVWEPFTLETGATLLIDNNPTFGYYHDVELMNLIAK